MHDPFARTPAAATGARIRELRERSGTSRSELSRRSGIHTSNVARLEFGEANPSLETLVRLADALGTSVADLVRDVGEVRGVARRAGAEPTAPDARGRCAG